mgnify:CR=1 FL=1
MLAKGVYMIISNVRKQSDIQPVMDRKKLMNNIIKHRQIYILLAPGFLFLVLFKFVPMWGLILAFKEYNPFAGILASKWVGFKFFIELFSDKNFYIMLRNTLIINLFGLIFFFPLPIILSVMLNEIRHESFKRITQSIVYLPHFLSWVVIASMTFFFFSVDTGVVNKAIINLGGTPISFLSNPALFWPLITIQTIWREMGWGTIILLASITGIDPQRYEAAVIDGATRWQQIWYITLPGIMPTIVVLLILRLGHVADVSLEQILLMQNPLVISVAEVFDTYAFSQGVQRGLISIGVTVGMFKSVINLVLVLYSNYIIKKTGQDGIF